MMGLDGSAIWRQALELDTTTYNSTAVPRRKNICVRVSSVCVSTTPTIRSARGVARRSIPRT
jgi:hypothetical protein